ncbi:helix-turn-helix transcriptional regulator [soil metagenome]
MPHPTVATLGAYLRDRRTRLDPVALGFPGGRRRTPGLRREEVALRSNISPTWYTWLEQGRGGAPSADVLNRIAAGLMLTEPEREHLFMLGLGRAPEVKYTATDGVTPRLQRVLEAFGTSPAIIKTATWDVVAWNRAAAAVLTDYATLPPGRRNILRLIFADDRVRAAQDDWESVARYVVGTMRADATRAGAGDEVARLVEDLSRQSPEFEAMWRENEVLAHHDGLKRLHHPMLGLIELEFSTFAVDGRPDLGLMVYNPVTEADVQQIRALIDGQAV